MSNILNMCHDLAKDLHQVGVMNSASLHRVEKICALKAEVFEADVEALERSVSGLTRVARRSEDRLKDPKNDRFP